MTEPAAESTPPDAWTQTFDLLRQRFPGQKPSVLFCLWKLQQNPHVKLGDFRAEAELFGVPVAGRALHSAKVLLGLEPRKERAPRAAEPAPAPVRSVAATPKAAKGSQGKIEDQLLAAVRRMQEDAASDVERLRAAIREAIDVLQSALGD